MGGGGDDVVDDASIIDGKPDDAPSDVPVAMSPARRKAITIDPARVTGSQTAFPVWVVLDDADLAARATANGADIFFTRSDSTIVPYEIQRWVKSSGHLEAWVKLDLADTTPTVFYIRYGEPMGAPSQAPASVFSSSFAAVWHLEDTLANTAVKDSTATHAGVAAGGLGATDQVTARLGGGIDFDGANNQITFTNPLTGGNPHTISAWVSADTPTSTYDSILTVGTAGTRQSRWLFTNNFNDNLAVGLYGDDVNTGDNVVGDGFILVHWTYDAGTSRIYRNGAQLGNAFTHAGAAATTGTGGYIGWAPMQWGAGGTTPAGLNGILDEVRIATVARSAGWIATEYANQIHSPTNPFYSVGSEEPVP